MPLVSSISIKVGQTPTRTTIRVRTSRNNASEQCFSYDSQNKLQLINENKFLDTVLSTLKKLLPNLQSYGEGLLGESKRLRHDSVFEILYESEPNYRQHVQTER